MQSKMVSTKSTYTGGSSKKQFDFKILSSIGFFNDPMHSSVYKAQICSINGLKYVALIRFWINNDNKECPTKSQIYIPAPIWESYVNKFDKIEEMMKRPWRNDQYVVDICRTVCIFKDDKRIYEVEITIGESEEYLKFTRYWFEYRAQTWNQHNNSLIVPRMAFSNLKLKQAEIIAALCSPSGMNVLV